ncbi:MAG: hypothetical protein ACRC1P_11190, partial [Cellulosilyticaceae bacterium]
MKSIPLSRDLIISSGVTYTISSADQLKFLSKLVNDGQDCLGATFLLTQDIELSSYKFAFYVPTGLVVAWSLTGQALFGLGTAIPGSSYWGGSFEGKIYYSNRLLNNEPRLMEIGRYENGIVYCGNNQYLLEDWKAIGTLEHPFKGEFRGNNKKIKGLFISGQNTGYHEGLFGHIGNEAEISGILLVDSYINGLENVGSIVGSGTGCTVKNCINMSTVIGDLYTGGIIGHCENGLITNCTNGDTLGLFRGTLSGHQCSAGIVGATVNTEVRNCVNHGYVGTFQVIQVGGIIGYALVTANNVSRSIDIAVNCINTGRVSCGSNLHETGECTGGIIGNLANFSDVCKAFIKNCTNTGYVSGTTEGTGGIMGYMENGIVEKCLNAGDVGGYKAVGGIVGYAYCGSSVKDCYNQASSRVWSSWSYVGGVVGGAYSESFDGKKQAEIHITNCGNAGAVICNFDDTGVPPDYPDLIDTAGGCAGGVIGYMVNSIFPESPASLTKVRNCFNIGPVTNLKSSNTGGIVGYCKDTTLENSYNWGVVKGEVDT